MQKHFLKFGKVFTNVACSPLILMSNNSELAAKYFPNDVDQSIATLEILNINNGLFQSNNIKQDKNFLLAENNNNNEDFQRGLLLDTKPKTKKPSMYNVLLLNDDYTPMEFVVMVLEKIFNKKQEEATQIMLHVHKNGIGVCGTFTYEVAESKCKSVMDMAKKNEHPLQCTMEKS